MKQATLRFSTPGAPAFRAAVKRADGDDGPVGTLEGYASVFYNGDPGTEYELWSNGAERVMERVGRGAFREALNRPDDVRALFNHDPDMLLGRSASGTCRLVEDSIGLRYTIDLPSTSLGRDVAELASRGDISGSSFGFIVDGEEWVDAKQDDDTWLAVRTITNVRLIDVSPVTYPAYSGTSATLVGRSLARTSPRSATPGRVPDWVTARLRVVQMGLEMDREDERQRRLDRAAEVNATMAGGRSNHYPTDREFVRRRLREINQQMGR